MYKQYALFVSHCWAHSDDYDRLIRLLDAEPYFDYRNYSIPSAEPLIARNAEALERELEKQIKPASIVMQVLS